MGIWRRRRDNKKAFTVRPKGGKSFSQTLNLEKEQGLTPEQLKKVLKSRKIEKDEIIPEEEIKQAQQKGESIEGRLLSLNPSNPSIDNIFVREDSPHLYDESELNQSIDLREEQNRLVAQEKGLEIQEDIEKMREEENREKSEKK